MKSENYHFWHSEKCEKWAIEKSIEVYKRIALIDGKELEYSIASEYSGSHHGKSWDDMKYLGIGVIHSITPIKKR